MVKRLGDKVDSALTLASLWMQPEGRELIMAQLEDIDVYKAFLEAQKKSSDVFEREDLMPMYERVARAIRRVDTNHILFLEAGYHTNAGVYSTIEPVMGQSGRRDPRQAYAPHAYDIVVDTPQLAQANTGRVELIFSRHGETAARLEMPMILGEYGAFGNAGEEILPSARVVMHMLEIMKCGDTYWDFGRKIQDHAYFETLNRPIPLRIAGNLIDYKSDPENLTFSCRWKEASVTDAPTIIYLPKRYHEGREITIDGGGIVESGQSEWGVYLKIAVTGSGKERMLSVR
jgi:endoglycosylceramidase